MSAEEVYYQVRNHQQNIDYDKVYVNLYKINDGAWNDIKINAPYYKWLSSAMDYLKPKQVIELGGAMGVGTLCMVSALPKASELYSITLAEHGLEFCFIDDVLKEKFPNMKLVIGDDLNLHNWPLGLFMQRYDGVLMEMEKRNETPGLANTDFWFIDTEHNYDQLHKELELYKPFFKKGAIICLDDIDINDGMKQVWQEVAWDKVESDLHWSGFGIVCI